MDDGHKKLLADNNFLSRLLNGSRLVVNLRELIYGANYLCVQDGAVLISPLFRIEGLANSPADWIVQGLWVKGDFRVLLSTNEHPEEYLNGQHYQRPVTCSDRWNELVHWQLEKVLSSDRDVNEPHRNQYRFLNVWTTMYLSRNFIDPTTWHVEIIKDYP